jgi:hypothetical protein
MNVENPPNFKIFNKQIAEQIPAPKSSQKIPNNPNKHSIIKSPSN